MNSTLIYSALIIVMLVALFLFRNKVIGFAMRVIPDQQAYNNVVMATCALVTLAWGAYTFDALQQRDKAAGELQELQKRLRDTESTIFKVDVGIEVGANYFYLTPVVTIKNVGNEALYLRMCKDSLTVNEINYSPSGQVKAVRTWSPQFYQKISEDKNVPHQPLYDMRVPISSERSLNFFVPVKNEGVYYVTFSAFSAPQDVIDTGYGNEKCSFKDGISVPEDDKISGKDSIWFSAAYVVVKKPKS